MIGITAGAALCLDLMLSWPISWIADWPLSLTFTSVLLVGVIWFGIFSYRVRIKVIGDYPTPGQRQWHWSAWHFRHYDRFLDKRVRYARHAQAIDETRADFARVGWGRTIDAAEAPDDWLIQKWFAGNHSDIGGSYPELESRLSDVALEWMAKEAEKIPHGLIIDGQNCIYSQMLGACSTLK
jgi:hypothetical protein